MKTAHRTSRVAIMATLVGLTLIWAVPARAQRSYTVTNLGSVAGAFETTANAINNRGEAVAISVVPPFETIGFVSINGQVTILPTLGGQFSFAAAINNPGLAVGSANFGGDVIGHAVIWGPDFNTVTDLGTLGGPTSSALWINDRGEIVGSSVIANGIDTHAFRLDNGKMTDLGTLGGNNSSGFAVNEQGVIIGQSDITTAIDPVFGIPQFHGFVWDGGILTDLGEIFGGHFNFPIAINDLGDIVGAADQAGDATAHAFLIRSGSITDLGTLPEDTSSGAFGLNDRGEIVGSSMQSFGISIGVPAVLTADCPCHAVIWKDGKMIDLNTLIPPGSGWQLAMATGINDSGQIVGNGFFNGSNDSSVFLLTPQDDDASATAAKASATIATATPALAGAANAGATGILIVNGRPRLIREQ